MKGTGVRGRFMVRGSTGLKMVPSISANGVKINNTDKAAKLGLTIPITKATLCTARSMGRERTSGLTTQFSWETLSITLFKATGFTPGQTARNMRASGKTARSMAEGNSTSSMEK